MNPRKNRQAAQRRKKLVSHARAVMRDLMFNGRTPRGFTAPELKSFNKNPADPRKRAYSGLSPMRMKFKVNGDKVYTS
jgi:hypothetical protein